MKPAYTGLLAVLLTLSLSPAPARAALRVEIMRGQFSKAAFRERIERSAQLLEHVLNSEAFRQRVLSPAADEPAEFREAQGLTRAEVLERILKARELDYSGADGVAELYVETYRSRNPWSSVAGYTREGEATIWVNERFLAREHWSDASIAANLAHEWMHKLGFTHAFRNEPGRDETVPYMIGRIVEELAEAALLQAWSAPSPR